MAFADLYHIEERLQQIDSRILRIDFDYKKRRHLVIAWNEAERDEYVAFTVPYGQLDARVVEELNRIRPERYNAFDELRAWEAKKEREEEMKIEDMARNMGDMLYRPLLRDATGA